MHAKFVFLFFQLFLLFHQKKEMAKDFFFHFIKKHTKNKHIKCREKKTIDKHMARICCKSGLPMNQAEEDSEEDCELPTELARLLKHEEKEIRPYKELVNVINLGFETDKKRGED